MSYNQSLTVKTEKITLNINDDVKEYPLLKVVISGKPKISDIVELIFNIEKEVNQIGSDYLSVTDFTSLDIGQFVEKILSMTIDKYLKNLVHIKNSAKISFVLLGDDSKMDILRKKLEKINEEKTDKDYSYNYFFIKDLEEVKEIAERELEHLNIK